MPFYRLGTPGEDTWAHLNMGRKAGPQQCAMPAFPEDNKEIGLKCGRMSVALCDGPGCDKPICELHRIKHATKGNTDFCSDHKEMAGSGSFMATENLCPCGRQLHPTIPLCLECYTSLDAKLRHAFSCQNPEQALRDAVAALMASGRIQL